MVESGAPYKKLLSYRYAFLLYHLTFAFCKIHLSEFKDKRTREQMEQAARSTKQNILEGATQGTSLKGYIKLVGVARGSCEELLEDYRDFAIRKGIPIWDWREERFKGDRRLRYFLPSEPTPPMPSIPPLPPKLELCVNLLLDLTTRTGYLLDQQRRSLEKKFLQEGGFTENLYRKRVNYRGY